MEFSRIVVYFIENGGEIFCKVIGKRKYFKGLRGGMVISCKLCWTFSNKRYVKKFDAFIVVEKIKIFRRYGFSV